MSPEHERNKRAEEIIIPDNIRQCLRDVIERSAKGLGFKLGRRGISDAEIGNPSKWSKEIQEGVKDIEILLGCFGLDEAAPDIADALVESLVKGSANESSRVPREGTAENKQSGLDMARTLGQMIREKGIDVSQGLDSWPMSVSVVLKIVTQLTSSLFYNIDRKEYTIALLEGYQSEERKEEGLATPPVTPLKKLGHQIG